MMFEQEYEMLLARQRKSASGQRLEMLNKDLSGTQKLLEVVVWPVLKSFEGITLEYELVSSKGAKIYIDVYYQPLKLAFESEGFVVHAEKITRDRFSFEKMRVRTMAKYGDRYIPFSRDELDKNLEACQGEFYELLGRYSSTADRAMEELSVFEREVIRYSLRLHRPLRLADVKYCLQCGYERANNVLRKMMDNNLIKPIGSGSQRYHEYELLTKGREYML
jgi:hypothetical protein